MKLKSQVKSGKQSSLVGLLAGIILLIFGVVFLIVIQSELSYSDSSGVLVSLFWICWILVMLLIIFLNARNLSSSKGTSMLDIDIETDTNTSPLENTIEIRLRQLEKLRNENLITEEEYKQKRTEIMMSKW